MTFALPIPKRAKMVARLIGGHVDPPGGKGSVQQRFLNVGDGKYAVDVTCPPMDFNDASALVGGLLRAQREEVTMPWIQPGLVNTVAAPTYGVDPGSSENATTIGVSGGGENVVRAFQFFNVIGPDGRRYLHAATQANVVPGTLLIAPALRIPAGSQTVLDFVTPLIQGFVQGQETPWTVDAARHYGVAFTVMERK